MPVSYRVLGPLEALGEHQSPDAPNRRERRPSPWRAVLEDCWRPADR
jgi:hypothetical protein